VNISEYIEQDMESRIRSGSNLPDRLTLSSIAGMYDVSLTPVRAALDGLIERRLLIKQENGRLQLGKARPGTRKNAPRPAPPVDRDAAIGREIILLSLQDTSDQFVREEAMAEQHGLGRSLVRSTFQRLAGGGMLEHVPRRGWRVPRFDQGEMDAYLDIRETLEVKAFDLGRADLAPDDLDRMIEGNGPAAVKRGAIDNTLHAYFVKQSGNRYIEAFFDANGRYYNALFDYAALGARVVAEMAAQHVEILEHARARRWAKSRTALAHHIQSQRPVMEAMIASVRTGR
jgi:DNA-binding GntR family transcriptional regulator